MKWTVLTSYIVQRQGTAPLDGNPKFEALWTEQIRITTNGRKGADATFGANTMRKSWENFVTVCREQRWEMAPSPYDAPVKAP